MLVTVGVTVLVAVGVAVLVGVAVGGTGVFVGVKQSADGGPPRVGVQIDLTRRLRLEAESGGNSLAGDRVGIGFEIEY